MGGRAGGGARSGGGGGKNPYRSEYDRAYNSQIKEIEGVIKEATSGGKYAKNAANYLKSEVLASASPAAVAQAKQMIKSNTFAYLSSVEINAIQKGAYSAAALKMKSKINKALKGL